MFSWNLSKKLSISYYTFHWYQEDVQWMSCFSDTRIDTGHPPKFHMALCTLWEWQKFIIKWQTRMTRIRMLPPYTFFSYFWDYQKERPIRPNWYSLRRSKQYFSSSPPCQKPLVNKTATLIDHCYCFLFVSWECPWGSTLLQTMLFYTKLNASKKSNSLYFLWKCSELRKISRLGWWKLWSLHQLGYKLASIYV